MMVVLVACGEEGEMSIECDTALMYMKEEEGEGWAGMRKEDQRGGELGRRIVQVS